MESLKVPKCSVPFVHAGLQYRETWDVMLKQKKKVKPLLVEISTQKHSQVQIGFGDFMLPRGKRQQFDPWLGHPESRSWPCASEILFQPEPCHGHRAVGPNGHL